MRKNQNWFDPSPVGAVEVENLQPGKTGEFIEEDLADPDALGFPDPLKRIKLGTYQVQALINHDQTRRSFNDGPGFGGRHLGLLKRPQSKSDAWKAWEEGTNPYRGFEIGLDPDRPLGRTVLADSVNNGPVGEALTPELIPAIEERFRILPEASARFVGGYSLGEWPSLWLQVAYPDVAGQFALRVE